ncbi:MAG TPA: hypothetical protein VEL77_10270, partial [Rugosimonospora sp.]|nr:hypothetical protein [Rugosimonospora sp.]
RAPLSTQICIASRSSPLSKLDFPIQLHPRISPHSTIGPSDGDYTPQKTRLPEVNTARGIEGNEIS